MMLSMDCVMRLSRGKAGKHRANQESCKQGHEEARRVLTKSRALFVIVAAQRSAAAAQAAAGRAARVKAAVLLLLLLGQAVGQADLGMGVGWGVCVRHPMGKHRGWVHKGVVGQACVGGCLVGPLIATVRTIGR